VTGFAAPPDFMENHDVDSNGELLNRRSFLSGTAMTLGAAGQSQAQAATRPNILHIMTDQQQWATLAGRSACRTPHLNRLASEGLLFNRSYTPSAVCCPARACILSGAYHWHNGVFNQIHSAPSVHRDMFPDVVLYSQRLRDAGYRLGYVGKWHASWDRSPRDFGFQDLAGVGGCNPQILRDVDLNPDRVEWPAEKLKITPHRTMSWPGSKPFVMWGQREGPEEATVEYHTAEQAIRMMRRLAKAEGPWHLETHFVAPHDAYLPLREYLQRYDPREIQVPASFRDSFQGKPGLHRRESETWGAISEDDYRQSRAHYYALVEQLDAQVGRILKALDETGQAGNTIVVFTTDHGDMVGAHRMWIKGWIPYEECYRVPLIVRWPGRIQSGGVTSHLVQTHDLGHTYLDAAGAKPLPYADGQSLLPLFQEPTRSGWRSDILGAYYGGEFLYTQRLAITSRFKYVFNGFDIDELYDLENDPEELRNVVSETSYARYAGDMRARLYELMARFEDPYGDVKARNSNGQLPDRYGASRYLPRGKRI
jgi:choline-sulfatase